MAIKKGKGRGWHGDKAAHSRAGSLGGKATAKNHGKDFFAKIGSSGGKISGGNFKNNTELASRAGRKGGKAKGKRKKSQDDF